MEYAAKSDLSASVGETSQQREKQDFSHIPFFHSNCYCGIRCDNISQVLSQIPTPEFSSNPDLLIPNVFLLYVLPILDFGCGSLPHVSASCFFPRFPQVHIIDLRYLSVIALKRISLLSFPFQIQVLASTTWWRTWITWTSVNQSTTLHHSIRSRLTSYVHASQSIWLTTWFGPVAWRSLFCLVYHHYGEYCSVPLSYNQCGAQFPVNRCSLSNVFLLREKKSTCTTISFSPLYSPYKAASSEPIFPPHVACQC